MTALLIEPIAERLQPDHARMLDLVEVAEDLGYRVLAVSTGSVTLGYHIRDIEVTVSGFLIDGVYLRRVLRAVKDGPA